MLLILDSWNHANSSNSMQLALSTGSDAIMALTTFPIDLGNLLSLNSLSICSPSNSVSRSIGVDILSSNGYFFVQSCTIMMPTDQMSPDASYCSPRSLSGDMYLNDPTEVLDIALELSRDREIPKSESFTSPFEFYRLRKHRRISKVSGMSGIRYSFLNRQSDSSNICTLYQLYVILAEEVQGHSKQQNEVSSSEIGARTLRENGTTVALK